jgi:hypothetical protein
MGAALLALAVLFGIVGATPASAQRRPAGF